MASSFIPLQHMSQSIWKLYRSGRGSSRACPSNPVSSVAPGGPLEDLFLYLVGASCLRVSSHLHQTCPRQPADQ